MKENLFSVGKTVYNALNVKPIRAYSTATEDRVRIEFIDGDRVEVGTFWPSNRDNYLEIYRKFYICPTTHEVVL
ncbi:MAG TPA: hypothetical protein VK031_07980 [Tissierellaceae bacterium]|nr:hypothetical protein [Tissierellaceae bacterium]